MAHGDLTGRTRHRAAVLRQGMSLRVVVLVLQVEYHNDDPDRSPGSDKVWRDATVEDLATVGKELYDGVRTDR